MEVHMSDLVVRKLKPEVVEALKQREATNGRSAEAEHREILQDALLKPRRRKFADVLASMPDVGEDVDFERVQSTRKAGDVFN
jgi:antitoxin FitA